jgi:hypothetical protein
MNSKAIGQLGTFPRETDDVDKSLQDMKEPFIDVLDKTTKHTVTVFLNVYDLLSEHRTTNFLFNTCACRLLGVYHTI